MRIVRLSFLIGILACGADAVATHAVIDTDAGAVDASSEADASDSPTPVDAGPRASLHVLFVGNSYTYVNDVPAILARIAETAPAGPRIETEAVVEGGFGLESHLMKGDAQRRIAEKTWTHVVLQGQSLEPTKPDYFLPFAKQIADLVVDAGARPTWFVTWARAPSEGAYPIEPEKRIAFTSPDELQDRLTSAYDEAARRAPGSLLACVGEAFRTSLRAHPELTLHQEDGSHATLAGSYLAASTIYVALTGRPVPEPSAVPAGLDASQAAALRGASLVGAACADVSVKAAVHLEGAVGIDGPDGGRAYDFGTAGTSVPVTLLLSNRGARPSTLSDGHTLGSPFEWTGGAFPGGPAGEDAGAFPFCSSLLAPGATCKASVTFRGTSAGTSRVTILTMDAYQSSVTRSLTGTSTERALLMVSEWSDDACLHCAPLSLEGLRDGITLVVTNRGARATTSIGIGEPLTSPLSWGEPDGGAGFPGGTGAAETSFGPPLTLPFCSPVLAPGTRCLVRVHVDGAGAGAGGQVPAIDAGPPVARTVSLSYADALGPIPTYASRLVLVR